jgi:hypothetical protein
MMTINSKEIHQMKSKQNSNNKIENKIQMKLKTIQIVTRGPRAPKEAVGGH